jgi:hypothetical protein
MVGDFFNVVIVARDWGRPKICRAPGRMMKAFILAAERRRLPGTYGA